MQFTAMTLKRERKKAKLTQMELARFASVNQSTVSRLENGELLNPSFEVLQQLAWALRKCGRKVTAADLQPRQQPVLVKGALAQKRKQSA
jgi:transcriptional regulator with XRE-family HTH domain